MLHKICQHCGSPLFHEKVEVCGLTCEGGGEQVKSSDITLNKRI